MKKFLLFIIITFVLFTCTSCGNKNVIDENSLKNETESLIKDNGISSESKKLAVNISSSPAKNEDMPNPDEQEIQPLNKDDKSIFDSKYYQKNENYGVAPSVMNNNDMPRPEDNKEWLKSLTISYPQLYNMKDIDSEERLNDILFKEALNIRDVINNRNYTDYNIDYSIMEASDKVLSVLFTGFIESPQKANSIAYSVTIDLSKERLMDLSEYFKIDESFVENHLHKDFKVLENNFDDLNENNTFVEEYVKNYNQIDHLHDYYITSKTLGLIIPAPQAMGYIILEGKIESK